MRKQVKYLLNPEISDIFNAACHKNHITPNKVVEAMMTDAIIKMGEQEGKQDE